MRLNMRSKPHTQLLRRLKHKLTVPSHDSNIDHDGWRLHVFELTAEEVVFESCVGGLRDEGWSVVGRCGSGSHG